MKSGFSFLLVLFACTWWQCSENPVNLKDNQIIDPALRGKFVTDTLFADFDTTYATQSVVSTLGSNRLLVGSFAGFTLRPIFRFNFNPLKFKVQRAVIQFPTLGIMGDNPQEFTVTAYPIKNQWQTNTDSVWSDYQSIVDYTRPIGSMTITATKDDTLELALTDTSLLNFWADSVGAAQNFGFILDFNSANFIKELKAGDSLDVSFILPGDTAISQEKVTVFDAFLVESNFQRVPDRNYVVTLTPYATILHFDLDSLLIHNPAGIIINSADLQLAVDWENTMMHPEFKANFHVLRLESELSDGNVVVDTSYLTSASSAVDMTRFTEDSIWVQVATGIERIDLGQNFLQRLLRDSDSFKGFYVEFINKVSFVSYFAFFRSEGPDVGRRPRLILKYWIPPEPRF